MEKEFFLSCPIINSDPTATNKKSLTMGDKEFEMLYMPVLKKKKKRKRMHANSEAWTPGVKEDQKVKIKWSVSY